MSDSTIGNPDSGISNVVLQDLSNVFITENYCKKEAILTPMPFYYNDSDNTDIFDYGGVIKSLKITGKYSGSSVSDCKSFIDSVESLIQGHQDLSSGYPLTFTDDLRGTIKVKISDFDSSLFEGNFIVIWTLNLFQSSENA